MVALDTKVAAVGVLAAIVLGALASLTGVGDESGLLGIALTLGVAFLLPQLYLLYRDADEVPRTTRLRSVAIVAVLWTWAAFTVADPPERTILGAFAVLLFVGWVVAEFFLGYRGAGQSTDR
jgi:hypothetical protein